MSMFLHTLRRGAVAAWLGALAIAQTPPVPPVDPNLPEQLKELKSMVAEPKMESDFRAIGLIQKLTAQPKGLNPKDKDKLAKALGDVFRTGKLRTGNAEILYREAADALGKLAEEGAKYLSRLPDEPRFKDNVPLVAHVLLALGATQDQKQVELLVETLSRSPHDELRAAAGEALGKYDDMDVKLRRDVVKTIIRSWGSLTEKATQPESSDPAAPINLDPQNARKTLRAVEGKWVRTLGQLTGVSMSGFADWQRWLNKNPNWNPPAKKP